MDGVKKSDSGEILSLTADGVEYALAPFMPDHFSAATNHLSAQRCKPLEALMREFETVGKNPILQQMLVEAAYKHARMNESIDKVPAVDVIAWMQTQDGSTFVFWQRMKVKAPDMTLEQATAIVGKAFVASIEQANAPKPDAPKAV